MSKHLQRDLDNLQRDLLALASSVEEAIHKSIRSLQERHTVIARQVIDGDNIIDAEENHVEEECLKLLALHQPVAIDLRRIASCLKINTELERMADLAEDIAERASALLDLPLRAVPAKLEQMANLTVAMVRQAIDSFVNLDLPLALHVCQKDDEVDQLNVEIIG